MTQAREQPWLQQKAPLWPTTRGCPPPPPENAALLQPPPFSNAFCGSLHHRNRVPKGKPHQMSSSMASAPVVPTHWTAHFLQMPLITQPPLPRPPLTCPGPTHPFRLALPGSPFGGSTPHPFLPAVITTGTPPQYPGPKDTWAVLSTFCPKSSLKLDMDRYF